MADPLIKVCGIRSIDILQGTLDLGVHYIGLNHFPKSPRFADAALLAQMIEHMRGQAKSVVLLVNPDDAKLQEIAALKPDYIQLHGSETPQRVREARELTGLPIIKALPIGDAQDVANVAAYKDAADILLLDAKPPKTATRPGGLGELFDWNLLKALDPSIKFMLSGGLSPDNVSDAVRQVAPWGLDVASGVESAPGEKSLELISKFVTASKSA